MGFKEYLRDEMEYQGLTTKELSERSGVSKRTIDNYLMANPQEPSVSNAYKIARALKVSIEYLLTGEEYTGNITLTGPLLEFLDNYQALPAEFQNIIENLVKKLSER